MSSETRPAEFYAAEYEVVLRAAKWIGSLLLLAQGGQIIYDLLYWMPRMVEVLDVMVEGSIEKAPAGFRLLASYYLPMSGLAGLLMLGGVLMVVTRCRLSAVVTIAGTLTMMFWAFGLMLNKILLTPLITIISNMGG